MIYKRSDIMSNNFLNENRCSLDVVVDDSVLLCEACRLVGGIKDSEEHTVAILIVQTSNKHVLIHLFA